MKTMLRRRWIVLLLAGLLLVGGVYLAGSWVALRAPRPLLRTAQTHPMQYYVTLPTGWTPTREWPIVVTVDGANSEFLQNCQAFMQARGAQPFILVTPFVVSNMGRDVDPTKYSYTPAVWATIRQQGALAFDEAGVLAAVEDVQAAYHGAPKFFLSGWSGGGNLTWWMVFTHPERLAGAGLAAANYFGLGRLYGSDPHPASTTFSTWPERATLPIAAFQGDGDSSLANLTIQWQTVQQVATQHGYENLTRTLVPRHGHEPFPDQVLAFFAAQLR